MAVDFRIGTSGWSYKEWVSIFYPSEKGMFSFYAAVFNTTEINSTFYSYPSVSLVKGWHRMAPEGFKFAAKVPREITHKKKLDLSLDVQRDVERFLNLMKPLHEDEKLGPLLLQLPPGFKRTDKNRRTLEKFLSILPSDYMFACEFRDESWLTKDTFEILREYNVAYVIVDEPLLPPIVEITADFGYVRWHGRGKRPWYNYRYKIEELKEWLPRIEEITKKVKVFYGLFNNHFYGYAALNALQLLKLLNIQNTRQAEIEVKMLSVIEAKAPKPVKTIQTTLIGTPVIELKNVEELLSHLIDWKRIARARRINDRDVNFLKISDKLIKAKIRDYKVIIDVENRLISHDCADWARTAVEKKFCKHLAKIFLLLPKHTAALLLKTIISERDQWTFKHEI